jgi:hypothetical protein
MQLSRNTTLCLFSFHGSLVTCSLHLFLPAGLSGPDYCVLFGRMPQLTCGYHLHPGHCHALVSAPLLGSEFASCGCAWPGIHWEVHLQQAPVETVLGPKGLRQIELMEPLTTAAWHMGRRTVVSSQHGE